MQMGDEPMQCKIVLTEYYDDPASQLIRFWRTFRGYIRKVKIYDWVKERVNTEIMYK